MPGTSRIHALTSGLGGVTMHAGGSGVTVESPAMSTPLGWRNVTACPGAVDQFLTRRIPASVSVPPGGGCREKGGISWNDVLETTS